MIRCIAIDDEPIALSIVRQYCERRGGIELETYSSPRAGMARVKEWRPDVVFLDIEMNGTSGIELARELPPACCLVFTTAYAHYALDGFEVDAPSISCTSPISTNASSGPCRKRKSGCGCTTCCGSRSRPPAVWF